MKKAVTFEQVVADYYIKKGFTVNATPLSNDYGVDILRKMSSRRLRYRLKCMAIRHGRLIGSALWYYMVRKTFLTAIMR